MIALFGMIVRRTVAGGVPQPLPSEREDRLMAAIRERVRRAIEDGCAETKFSLEFRSDEAYGCGWPESDIWPRTEI